MRGRSRFPGGAYLDNPHIIFAILLSFAVLAFQDNWIVGFVLVIACVVSGALFTPIFRLISFVSRCAAPLLLGVLIVMVYVTLHSYATDVERLLQVFTGIFPSENLNVAWMLESAKFNDEYKEVFYQAISTLYAIIVGLALVKGIEDVSEARKILAQEVYVVRSIWSYLKYFEADEVSTETLVARRKMRAALISYTGNVGAGNDTKDLPHNQQLLDHCRTQILDITPFDRDDEIAQQEIIREYEKLGVLRAQRIGNIGGKISRFLLAALWMMSLALILPFLAEPLCVNAPPPVAAAISQGVAQGVAGTVDRGASATKSSRVKSWEAACPNAPGKILNPDRFSQYYMIFIMVAFFSFLMLMLHDISTPDNGFWKVDTGPFRILNAELDEDNERLLEEEHAIEAGRVPSTGSERPMQPFDHVPS